MGRLFWAWVHDCVVHPGLWWVGFEGSPLRDTMIEFHAMTGRWAWPEEPEKARMEGPLPEKAQASA